MSILEPIFRWKWLAQGVPRTLPHRGRGARTGMPSFRLAKARLRKPQRPPTPSVSHRAHGLPHPVTSLLQANLGIARDPSRPEEEPPAIRPLATARVHANGKSSSLEGLGRAKGAWASGDGVVRNSCGRFSPQGNTWRLPASHLSSCSRKRMGLRHRRGSQEPPNSITAPIPSTATPVAVDALGISAVTASCDQAASRFSHPPPYKKARGHTSPGLLMELIHLMLGGINKLVSLSALRGRRKRFSSG